MRTALGLVLLVAGGAIAVAGVIATGPGAFYVIGGTILLIVGGDLVIGELENRRARRRAIRAADRRRGYLHR